MRAVLVALAHPAPATLAHPCTSHTWGQNLSRHVHLHCLVPGGAWCEGGQWKASREAYLFPVRALSRCFRGTFVSALREKAEAGELDRVRRPWELKTMLDTLMAQSWVVYANPCLSHTTSVIDYLARYTHRIAITDARIVAVNDATVSFRYKDYRHGGENRVMALEGGEFVRRFVMHILPKGFTAPVHPAPAELVHPCTLPLLCILHPRN